MKSLKDIAILFLVMIVFTQDFERMQKEFKPIEKLKPLPITLITCTNNLLQVVSSLGHADYKWTKLHRKTIESGYNYFDCALNDSLRIEFKIWNYKH